MGALTDFTYEHPDRTLAAIGALGGFILGAATVGFGTGVAAAVGVGALTFTVANVSPHPPEHGPQH